MRAGSIAVVLGVVPDEADRALHVLDRAGVVEARHRAMVQGEDGVAGLQQRRAPDRDLVLLERRRVVGGRRLPAAARDEDHAVAVRRRRPMHVEQQGQARVHPVDDVPLDAGAGDERLALRRGRGRAPRARPGAASSARRAGGVGHEGAGDLDYDDGAADVHLVAGGELQAVAAGRHLDQASAARDHRPVRALLVEHAIRAGGGDPRDVGVRPRHRAAHLVVADEGDVVAPHDAAVGVGDHRLAADVDALALAGRRRRAWPGRA